MKSKATRPIVAHIFLRSTSGKSVRELGKGPPPGDLSPFLAPPSAREEVRRALESRGFRVFLDDSGLFISIEASAALFAKTFGVEERSLLRLKADETFVLPPPLEIRALVEEIVVAPAPEMF